VAIVGAGWIGAEVAASARQLGTEVTLIEQGDVPLEHVLGREAGGLYADLHREHGVELLTGTGVAAFEGDRRVARVRLADGRAVEAGLVVVGVGVSPRDELAAQAGLAVDDGVLVDERLQTSDPAVFAAGDVARVHHPFYGAPLRVEHWASALRQPEVAARAMLGKPARWERLPYFFSDQYDVGMEYTGLASGEDRVVVRGRRDARELIFFWLRDGRVVAAMNVNVWDVADDLQALIRSRERVDPARLGDPDVPLAELVSPSPSRAAPA
jgi:3-phenylpropionate/trans-cinnamate dioxygenase ferredoxin reductase subunit